MANFVGLGQSVANVVKLCVDNNNKQNIAQFLINQQNIIQNGVIDARINAKQVDKNSGGNVNSNTGAKSKGQAAFKRMKAMGGKK